MEDFINRVADKIKPYQQVCAVLYYINESVNLETHILSDLTEILEAAKREYEGSIRTVTQDLLNAFMRQQERDD